MTGGRIGLSRTAVSINWGVSLVSVLVIRALLFWGFYSGPEFQNSAAEFKRRGASDMTI